MLISMGNWVIFLVWLLIKWLVNVPETITDVLKHGILQTSGMYVAKNHLKWHITLLLINYSRPKNIICLNTYTLTKEQKSLL